MNKLGEKIKLQLEKAYNAEQESNGCWNYPSGRWKLPLKKGKKRE